MKLDKEHIKKFAASKKGIIIISIIVALLVFRLFLPYIVKHYVNRTLNNIPGYHGSVDDIDIALIRGAYVIKGLHLYKNGNKMPMLDLPSTDISIEWKSLFHGRIVSEIEMLRPKFNLYVTANKLSEKETPKQSDWTAALKKLVPIKINRLKVEDGEFLFADIVESPDINLKIQKIDLIATNLGNVADRKAILPSDITAHAISFGGGNLIITGKMNMLKKIPDMDMNISLKNSDVTALNTVTLATAGFDFEKGRFELYSEFAINNGYLKGYFKPMFHDIKIPDSLGKPNSNILKRLWEGVITFVGFVLKNKKMDSFATKVPMEGNLNDPNLNIWKMITNIFRNGFIQPFKSQVDEDIKFGDATPRKAREKEKQKEKEKKKKQ